MSVALIQALHEGMCGWETSSQRVKGFGREHLVNAAVDENTLLQALHEGICGWETSSHLVKGFGRECCCGRKNFVFPLQLVYFDRYLNLTRISPGGII